ncbi:MAG: nitrilase-related carbon-nitrogen hydrolase, partial [Phycisphaerae bacterium]
MKVALAQMNPLVGDVDGNTQRILRAVDRAADAGADLVVTPELAVLGYPPKDLLLKEHLIRRNLEAVDRIARASRRIAIVVGYAQPSDAGRGKPLHNAAALCLAGTIAGVHGKHLLPTYDVFDEKRYFQPVEGPTVTRIDLPGFTGKLGISICEDLWNYASQAQRLPYRKDPIDDLVESGADLLLNISASPYCLGKQKHRLEIFSAQVARHHVPLIYVNQVGAHDDLIFDGASAVFSATGQVIAQGKAFEEDLLLVDLDQPERAPQSPYPEDIAGVYHALRLGTRDYVNKCGFQAVVLGRSGGIDSAVTAAIAAQALGPDRVHGVALPSRYSSDHSLTDAGTLARNLGIDLLTLPIQ